jgi:hypothetical protein
MSGVFLVKLDDLSEEVRVTFDSRRRVLGKGSKVSMLDLGSEDGGVYPFEGQHGELRVSLRIAYLG